MVGLVNFRALPPSFSSVLAKHTMCMHETITFLLVTLPNIHRFKKNSLTDSALNLS